jgi:TrmH family RNA methyltransferase
LLNASKNLLKLVQKLKISKFRNLEQKFIVEGDKLVLESIQNIPQEVVTVFITNTSKIPKESISQFDVYQISNEELDKISTQKNPQHSLAIVKSSFKIKKNKEQPIILICDGIQDPGNFGTIIRTADWFGIQTIIASENTVDRFNPKVIQASMGSIFRVEVSYENLQNYLKGSNRLKIATTLDGGDLFNFETNEDIALIIGNEGKGVSSDLLQIVDVKIKIPGFGAAESLNASVASGIVIAQLKKSMQNA